MAKVAGICGECNKYYSGVECPQCAPIGSGRTVNVIMDIQPHYNRGLGEWVNSRSSYRALCREKGLVEVGNEKKYVDPERQRAMKEREAEKSIEALRPQAHAMLGAMWN